MGCFFEDLAFGKHICCILIGSIAYLILKYPIDNIFLKLYNIFGKEGAFMNSIAQEYINKQREIAQKEKLEERSEFLEDIGLYERIYSDNTKYTDEFPIKDTDEESEHFGKYYKKIPISLTDEEYEEVLKAYKLNNEVKTSEDSVAQALRMIAIFIYVIGGLLSILSFSADFFAGMTASISVIISGTSFLGFSRIINLLNNIKNK